MLGCSPYFRLNSLLSVGTIWSLFPRFNHLTPSSKLAPEANLGPSHILHINAYLPRDMDPRLTI